MHSISIGPLAFPVAPLIVLVSIWIGAWVAGRVAQRNAPPDQASASMARSENAVWTASIIGLLAARLAYLIRHYDAYLQHPWSVIDIRDGGWVAWAGFLAGAVWLAIHYWRKRRNDDRPALTARAIAIGSGTIAGLWLALNTAVWVSQGAGQHQPLPDTELADLNGGPPQSLNVMVSGKPAVINLWATWCGPCRIEMPILAQAQKDNPDIQFVFANQGENKDAINRYLTREKLQLQGIWLDPRSQLGPQIGSNGLPTTLFVNAAGEQVDVHFGVLNAASLSAKLDAIRQSGRK